MHVQCLDFPGFFQSQEQVVEGHRARWASPHFSCLTAAHGCGQAQCYSWVENGERWGWAPCPSAQWPASTSSLDSTLPRRKQWFSRNTALSQLQQTWAVLHPVQFSHPQVLCISTYALAGAAVQPGCFFINYISSLAKIIWRWPQQTSFLRKSRVCASQR